MPRPMQMDKPSEPLGTSLTLGELQLVIARAIATYGSGSKIYGDNDRSGIVLHVHFPSGLTPYVTFAELSYPEDLSE
jgi:hypothetical protein